MDPLGRIDIHTWVSANGIAERGTTPGCGIAGEAIVTRTIVPGNPQQDQLEWTRADPDTHISDELLRNLDDSGWQFLADRYELGGPCPYHPGTRQAKLRRSAA